MGIRKFRKAPEEKGEEFYLSVRIGGFPPPGDIL
jgi:hypothetical protein